MSTIPAGVPTETLILFPNVVTIALGALTWLLGVFLVRRIAFLSRYNFPAPVIGGLVVAVLFQILHQQRIPLPKFDTELVDSLIIAFFASLGFGASLRALRKGGRDVMTFLIACTVLLFIQAGVGLAVASALGEHPLFGVLAGIVALTGGPGTALAFAPAFEQAGVANAASIGLAAAMGGLLIGGVLGGPVATIIIDRKKLTPANPSNTVEKHAEDRSDWLSPDQVDMELLWQSAYLLIVGSIGWYLSKWLSSIGVTLPFYIGAMFVAAVVRNLDDATGCFKLNMRVIDAVGTACLTFFVATMMMTLQLWTVSAVANSLLIVLAVQSTIIVIAALTVMFRVSGNDYDAAVISGGLVGFMLGTTATSLAAMSAITSKYGPAPRAFLVVPIVGACFIDFVNALVISLGLNLFGIS